MTHIFIFNPFSSNGNSSRLLREELKRFKDLRYFIFNLRENFGFKETIDRILHIFSGEELRFYCCGGSGTFRNTIACFDSFENVEFTFYPHGLTNDFLKVFGDKQELFFNINELIYGDPIDIDYIRSNCGVALNTFSTGIDADYARSFEGYKALSVLNPVVPHILSAVHTFIHSKSNTFEVELDNLSMKCPMLEIVFANGFTLGGIMKFSDNTPIDDGLANYAIVPKKKILSRLKIVLQTVKGDLNAIKRNNSIGLSSHIRIKRVDGKPFTMNLDGETVGGVTECSAEVVKRGLRFVVPHKIAEEINGRI